MKPPLNVMFCVSLLALPLASSFSKTANSAIVYNRAMQAATPGIGQHVGAPPAGAQTAFSQSAPGQGASASQPPIAPTVIHVTAQKYHFDPSPIHVSDGATVELHIMAVDHAHGFLANIYPDRAAATPVSPALVFTHPQNCWKIEKGQEVVIEFVARRPGTYAFRCCNFCGFGHLGMKGEIIVDP